MECRIQLVALCAGFGSLFHKQEQDEAARGLIDQAAHSWKEPLPLSSSSSIALCQLSEALGRLRQLSSDLGDRKNSRAAGQAAVRAMEKAYEKVPTSKHVQEYLGNAYHKLADVYWTSGDSDDLPNAESLYLKAIRLREPLLKENPSSEFIRTELTYSFTHLGQTLRKLDRPKEAQAALLKAVGIWTSGIGDLPKSKWEIATFSATTKELIDVSLLTTNGDDNQSVYSSTIATWRKLFEDYPAETGYRVAFAGLCGNLAKKYRTNASHTQAKQLAEISRVVCHKLTPLEDVSANVTLARSQRNLAWDLMNLGQTQVAEEISRQSVDTADRALRRAPDSVECLATHAWALQELGNVLQKTESKASSAKVLRDAMMQWEKVLQLSSGNPTYLEQYGNSVKFFAEVSCVLGKWNEEGESILPRALKVTGEATNAWRSLPSTEGGKEYIATCRSLADAIGRLDHPEQIKHSMSEMLNRLSDKATTFEIDKGALDLAYSIHLAFHHVGVGIVYARLGMMDDATKAFAAALDVVETIPDSNITTAAEVTVIDDICTATLAAASDSLPSIYERSQRIRIKRLNGKSLRKYPIAQFRLAWAYDALAVVMRKQHSFEGAERCYRLAISLREHLVSADYPEVAMQDHRQVLGETWRRLAWVLAEAGRLDDSVEAIRKSVEILPDSALYQACHAGLLLLDDRVNEYEHVCEKLVARFGHSTNPAELAYTARAWTLKADASGQDTTVELARSVLAKQDVFWISYVVGRVLYPLSITKRHVNNLKRASAWTRILVSSIGWGYHLP